MSYGREQGSWWSRNWFWAVGCGCLALIVLPLGVCGVGLGVVVWQVRGMDVVEQARDRAAAHPEVAAALGEPLSLGWSGRFDFSSGAQGAELDAELPISGPEGSGTLCIEATRAGEDEWNFRRLEVWLEDGSRIDLLSDVVPQTAGG